MNIRSFSGALAIVAFAQSTHAAVIVNSGDTKSISDGSVFVAQVNASGGAGSWSARFDYPTSEFKSLGALEASAIATVGPFVAATFTDLKIQWSSTTNDRTLSKESIRFGQSTVYSGFSGTGTGSQTLTVQWSESLAGWV